ncbi:hypothetical protein D3C72_2290360 [compost metagenome]
MIWFSGARRRSLMSLVCVADGIGSVPLASPTPMWVICHGIPRASAFACLATPMLVRMAKNCEFWSIIEIHPGCRWCGCDRLGQSRR